MPLPLLGKTVVWVTASLELTDVSSRIPSKIEILKLGQTDVSARMNGVSDSRMNVGADRCIFPNEC